MSQALQDLKEFSTRLTNLEHKFEAKEASNLLGYVKQDALELLEADLISWLEAKLPTKNVRVGFNLLTPELTNILTTSQLFPADTTVGQLRAWLAKAASAPVAGIILWTSPKGSAPLSDETRLASLAVIPSDLSVVVSVQIGA